MWKNYLISAWRNLTRNKHFALINILGLGMGIATCLLVFTMVYFEWSTDRFHSNYHRIARAYTWWTDAPPRQGNKGVPLPFKEAFRTYYGEDLRISALGEVWGQIDITGTDKHFKAEFGFVAVEPSFAGLFDFSYLAGSPQKGLGRPGSVFLSKGTAEKYFGAWDNALGRQIQCMNGKLLSVAGIFEDLPPNTDFPFKALFSYADYQDYVAANGRDENDWGALSSNEQCYILLPEGKTIADMNALMPGFLGKVVSAQESHYEKQRYSWQPLKDMHYSPYLSGLFGRTVDKTTLLGLSLIGLFLLLLACVNYINLATAQAVTRSREVGVRKALGGTSAALRRRFLTESFVITLLAIIAGLGLAALLMPLASHLSDRPLSFAVTGWHRLGSFLTATLLLVTLLAGYDPSWQLGRFNVAEALKSKYGKSPGRTGSLRRTLVIFQFTVAQVFLVCVLVVASQLSYLNKMDMGFNKDAIVLLQIPADSLNTLKAFKEELSRLPGIAGASYSNVPPSSENRWSSPIFLEGKAVKDPNPHLFLMEADFLSLYDIPLLAGRNINPSQTIREVLVNEAFLRHAGLDSPVDALGKMIALGNGGENPVPIVGVVKDFHSQSFKIKVPPIVMTSMLRDARLLNIKIAAGDFSQGLKAAEQTWTTFFPDKIFEYQFLDKQIEDFYKQERRLGQVIKICAGIAIFISCMGLYGLMLFMSVQRTKEVGIRKVLGATIGQICVLFGKDFIKLVSAAFIIAAPIAWYVMARWLENFAYRIQLEWWIFALAGLLAVVIALLTVSFHAVKAALVNPVKSLRSE